MSHNTTVEPSGTSHKTLFPENRVVASFPSAECSDVHLGFMILASNGSSASACTSAPTSYLTGSNSELKLLSNTALRFNFQNIGTVIFDSPRSDQAFCCLYGSVPIVYTLSTCLPASTRLGVSVRLTVSLTVSERLTASLPTRTSSTTLPAFETTGSADNRSL